MSNLVEYILELRDNMSATLNKIGIGAEATMSKITVLDEGTKSLSASFSTMKGMVGAMGIGFAFSEMSEGIHESVKEIQDLNIANAQIRAGLLSTAGAAGLVYGDVQNVVDKLRESSNYTKNQIASMEAVVLTFPNVTKKSFGSASQAILDMGTRLNQDLRTTAIQVGKALQDPVLGMTAMRRMGVNFDKEETNYVKGLIAHGNKAAAQTFILTELYKEFGGSAKAAFDANPLSQYGVVAEEMKEKIGGLILKIQTGLEPTLISLTHHVISSIDWMEKHKTIIELVAGAIAVYSSGMMIEIGISKLAVLWETIQLASINVLGDSFLVASVATKLFAAAQWGLNIALSANPIGAIIMGVTLLTTGIIALWKSSEKFREVIFAGWEVIKSVYMNIAQGYIQVVKAVASVYIWLWDNAIKPVVESIWAGIKWVMDKITPVFNAIGSFFVDLWKTVKGIFENIWQFAVSAFDKIMGKLSGIFAPIRALWNKLFPSDKFQDLGEAAAKGVSEGAKSWQASQSDIKMPKLAGVVKPEKAQNGAGGSGAGATQAIATGGTRNTQITIKLGTMVENIIFNGGLKENAQEMRKQVEEVLLQVLYAAESAG